MNPSNQQAETEVIMSDYSLDEVLLNYLQIPDAHMERKLKFNQNYKQSRKAKHIRPNKLMMFFSNPKSWTNYEH